MILAGIIALALGVLQYYMLSVVTKAALNKSWLKTLLVAAAKLILYFVGIFLIVKVFRAYVIAGCVGFGIGFFTCITVSAIRTLTAKQN